MCLKFYKMYKSFLSICEKGLNYAQINKSKHRVTAPT